MESNELKQMNEEINRQTAELDEILKTVDKLIDEVKTLTIAAVIIKDEVKKIKVGKRSLKNHINK